MAMMGDMPMPQHGEEEVLCLQMTVGFRDSVGMFLFEGWDAGRKSNFGYYFATLVFVATLAFIVEAVPIIRSKFLNPHKEVSKAEYVAIQRVSTVPDQAYTSQPHDERVSFGLHLVDTFIQMIANVCMYLLMVDEMCYTIRVIMTASVALPLANFIFSIIQDRIYINQRLRKF